MKKRFRIFISLSIVVIISFAYSVIYTAAPPPTVSILNPKPGTSASPTPVSLRTTTNDFKVQIQVWNDVADITSVSAGYCSSTSDCTIAGNWTWVAASLNSNYNCGTNCGIYEVNLSGLTAGNNYNLRARAVSTADGTGYSSDNRTGDARWTYISIKASGTGTGMLIGRDVSSQLCIDCHNLKSHSSQTTDTSYGNWQTVCYECHNPHGTRNIYLIRESIVTPNSGTNTVTFYNTTGDATNSYVTTGAANGVCEVCHTQTTGNSVARWRNSGNSDTHYTAAAGTQRCINCHPHSEGFKGKGACRDCHNTAQGIRRQIVGGTAGNPGDDFIRSSRHVSNGTTTDIVSNFDCIVCHAEGDTTSSGTNIGQTSVHDDNMVSLRNVDNQANPGAAGTNYWQWPGSSSAITADRDNMDSFCMACHDSDTSYQGSNVPESGDGRIVWARGTSSASPMTNVYTARSDTFTATEEKQTGAIAAIPYQMILKASPTNKNEMIAGYVSSAGQLYMMCYNAATDAWSDAWNIAVGGTGTTRRFDIAYENQSGDVMVLYSTNQSGANPELAYNIKLASGGTCGAWQGATNLNPTNTTGVVHWVKLASDSRSNFNLIAAIWADANADLASRIWDGSSSWGNESLLETSLEVVSTAQDVEDFDVEYESVSGNLLVVWANSAGANGTNGARYKTCTGGSSTCSWSGVLTPSTFADDATNLDLCADPLSNSIIFASIGNAGSDYQHGVWNGSAWTNYANVDTAAGTPAAGTHMVTCGWVNNGSTKRGIIAFHDAGAYVAWVMLNGTTFTRMADWGDTGSENSSTAPYYLMPSLDPDLTGTENQYEIQVDPINKDRLMLLISDSNSDIFAKRLIMDVDSGGNPIFRWSNSDDAGIEVTTSTGTYKPWSFAFQRSINSGNRGGGAATITVDNNNPPVGLLLGTVSNPVSKRYSPFNMLDALLFKKELDNEVGTWPAGLKYLLMERKARGRAQRSTESSLNTEAKGLLPDVKGQFNYRNFNPSTDGKKWASHHNLNQFQKRYASNNTTYMPSQLFTSYLSKENKTLNSGAVDSGTVAGLHCSDCHLNETNAHGTANSWYMLSDKNESDNAFANSGKSISTDICVKCHNLDSYTVGGAGTYKARIPGHAANSTRCNNIETDDVDKLSALGHIIGNDTASTADDDQLTCLGCHGGRDFGDIHGTNFRYRVGGDANSTSDNVTKRYRFMSGASMRWFRPNNATGVTDASWEVATGTAAGCYTIKSADMWGACTAHAGSYQSTDTSVRQRPLQY